MAGQSHVKVITSQCPAPCDTAVPPISIVATGALPQQQSRIFPILCSNTESAGRGPGPSVQPATEQDMAFLVLPREAGPQKAVRSVHSAVRAPLTRLQCLEGTGLCPRCSRCLGSSSRSGLILDPCTQPQCPPSCSLNIPSTISLQGVGTCCSFCLECSYDRSEWLEPSITQG